MRMIEKEQGVTLVELLTVVVLIAVLAGMAALSIDFLRKEQLSSQTKELLAALQEIRVDAKTLGPSTALPDMRGIGIRLVNRNEYVTFKFNDCDRDYVYDIDTCSGSTREEADAETRTFPASVMVQRLAGGVLIDPANAVAEDIRIFDRFGMPRKSDWSADTGANLILVLQHTGFNYGKCIMISTNTVREGKWNGTTCTEQ